MYSFIIIISYTFLVHASWNLLKSFSCLTTRSIFLGTFTNPRLLQLLDNEMNKSSVILHLQDWSNCLTTRRRIPRHFYHFKTANSNDDNEMANSSATLSLRNLITILIVVQYLQDFTFLTYNFNDLPRGLLPYIWLLNFCR